MLLYAFAWVVTPLEPEAQGVDTTKAPDVRGLTIAVFIAGAVVSALLLVADGSTTRIGAGVVLAPMAIAVGGAVIRRGSLRSKGTLLVTGIALTAALGWLNYHPGFGDRTIRPEIHELSPGFSNLFGTLTIDLSAYEVSSGNLTVNAKTLGGDIVLRVPENASVQVDESIVFGATERNDASGPPRSLAIRLDVKGVVGSVRVLRGR